ncbi:hypothetical protein F52700_5979 [Fusarium sp. NRRL 52700]|nr:hypothetical protein F52700_5979 [Fusarium sp. NRRL 52700]
MSSEPTQSALNAGESYMSPTMNLEPDSDKYRKIEAMMERMMAFMCEKFQIMNDRISELRTEVGEISAGKTMSALQGITERLRHFDAVNVPFNEIGMLDHGNINALDLFNRCLVSIEEELKCLKHSIRGTAEECDDSIKSYLSNIDERIVNLDGNLHRLEDRMFANLDGAIDDETGFITLVMDPVDFQKLEAFNPTEIAEKLRQKGSGWKIESLKLKPPKTADQKPQVLINFLTRASEKYMREHISEMSGLFGLEHGVFCLSPVYTLHVEHLAPHMGNKNNNMGDKELEEAVLKALGVKDLKAKVTYDRMLLKTQSFDLVNRLCLTGLTIFGHYYQIVPFCVQGTPLFCHRCWKASHFKEECTTSVMLCGRCSGTHDTRGCKAAARCCNCNGPHTTWSPECNNVMSRNEHRNSAWYRRLSPHWAKHLDKTGKPTVPTVTKPKAGKAKAAESSPTTSGDQSGTSSQAEKRPVGRPKTLPVKEPRQQTLGQFLKTAGNGQAPTPATEPSSSADADMTGTDTASQDNEGTEVTNSSTPSSTADVPTSSASTIDSSPAAMEVDTETASTSTPSESQSSGSVGDSSAANMDIDTADNEPIESHTPEIQSPESMSDTQTKSNAKGSEEGSNKNKDNNKKDNNNKNKNKNNNNNNNNNNKNKNKNNNNNKNKNNKNNNNKNSNKNSNKSNGAVERKTQTTDEVSTTPSSGSDPSQPQVDDNGPILSNRKKRIQRWKQFRAWDKAQDQAQAQAAASTNDPPAPVSGASDIPPPSATPPVPPPSTTLNPTISSAPTPSAPATSVPATSVPATSVVAPLQPISPSKTPPASTSSTTSDPSAPIFTTINSLLPPPPAFGNTQPSDFNFEELAQVKSISGKREGPLDVPPPEKRRKPSRSIENGDEAREAFNAVVLEENASGSQT